jgi:hypothetical protein
MAIDPKTGEEMEDMPADMTEDSDIQKMLAAADEIIEGDAAPAAEEGMDEAPMEEENMEGVDLSPIEEALNIDSASAAALWEASRDREDLAMLTPEELADRLAEDFGLRMQLEKAAAMKEGDITEEDMMEEPPMMEEPMMEEPMMEEPAGMMPGGM